MLRVIIKGNSQEMHMKGIFTRGTLLRTMVITSKTGNMNLTTKLLITTRKMPGVPSIPMETMRWVVGIMKATPNKSNIAGPMPAQFSCQAPIRTTVKPFLATSLNPNLVITKKAGLRITLMISELNRTRT